MKSGNYDSRLPLFGDVFKNGVCEYVHETGVIGQRIVSGVEEAGLDPYYMSQYLGRAKGSGDYSIFLADTEETARSEVFQDEEFTGYPQNTWLLEYEYHGTILNISRIQNQEFTDLFLQESGVFKREFSQDVRHYLEEKQLVDSFDSIGWHSVKGKQLGEGGFIYNFVSGVEPRFEFQGKKRLA